MRKIAKECEWGVRARRFRSLAGERQGCCERLRAHTCESVWLISQDFAGSVPGVNDAEWKAFGGWLYSERALSGRNRTHIARAARISPSTLATLEKGGRNIKGVWTVPSPDDITLIQIARALNIPLDVMSSRAQRHAPVDLTIRTLDGRDIDISLDDPAADRTEQALATDADLEPDQRETLIRIRRSFIHENKTIRPTPDPEPEGP